MGTARLYAWSRRHPAAVDLVHGGFSALFDRAFVPSTEQQDVAAAMMSVELV
jgi:hypothetical protein